MTEVGESSQTSNHSNNSLSVHWSFIEDGDLLAACDEITVVNPNEEISVSVETSTSNNKRNLFISKESPCCSSSVPHKFDSNTLAARLPPTKRKKWTHRSVPLFSFRRGKLFVTDFCSQLWCELQLWNRYTKPFEDIEYIEPPEVAKGTVIHEARDLEVNTYVPIQTTSKEDRFALRVINVMQCLLGLLQSVHIQREISIFGFIDGTFVSGKIDELRMDPMTFDIDVVELKTRASDCMPSRAQRKQHSLQVMLYKRLFDNLVQNKLPKLALAKCMYLNLNSKFGKDILQSTAEFGKGLTNLNKLLDRMLEIFQSAPFISQLLIEYTYQATKETIGIEVVQYDEKWLMKTLTDSLKFWRGQREAKGVDIEDLWKCSRCEYENVCVWRAKLIEENKELLNKNTEIEKDTVLAIEQNQTDENDGNEVVLIDEVDPIIIIKKFSDELLVLEKVISPEIAGKDVITIN